jgi:ABC-type transport system involved in cytochrome bd biosynthesis fused ATPase/permease subunit
LHFAQILFAEFDRSGVDGYAFFTLGQIPAFWMLIALLVCFFAYMALGFLLERLLSPEYGDRPSWLQRLYCGSKVSDWQNTRVKYADEDFEGADVGWHAMIRVNDVWKVFQPPRHETVVAVRGITLDIYDSQITCILGHNGAGKSTLMAMMTRLLRPTAGTITFSDPVR